VDTHIEHVDEPDQVAASSRRAPSRSKLLVRLVVMAVILAVVFGGFYAYERFREQAIANFFASNKPPPLPVAATTATAMDVPRYLSGIGSLNAVHQVTAAPEVGGRVTGIFFESGATVRTGDPLVQLNDAPDRADLANYQAQARLAQTNLTRASTLAQRQFETQATVDTDHAQLEEASAQIARTEATIAQKLVRAPFAGELGIRQVNLGQYVGAGTALVTLTDLDSLHVDFTLPENTRSQLAVGQVVLTTVDAFPGRSFEAKLTTIEPQINADTRTIKLQATLANPDHLLLPGMFVHARVTLPDERNVVVLPETAVDFTLYGNSVFLIVKDGDGKGFHVKRQFVTTGDRFDNKVAVVSGIQPGDRAVAGGQLKLIDGAAVLPTATPLTPPTTVPVN